MTNMSKGVQVQKEGMRKLQECQYLNLGPMII
jgi:hypothetical protein